MMNYYVLVLACILSNSLFGMQKVAHSEALVPGGKIGNYLLFTYITEGC